MWRSVTFAAALLATCSACGSEGGQETTSLAITEAPTTSNAPSTSQAENNGGSGEEATSDIFEVTFSGDGCAVTGASDVPAGDYSFVLTDESDSGNAELYVRELVDGHTYQDLVDLQNEHGGPGASFLRPDWVVSTLTSFALPDLDLAHNQHLQGAALKPGTHVLLIWTPKPEIWLCAQLVVGDL